MTNLLQLTGFNVLKKSDMIVIKKIVGNYLSTIMKQGEVKELSLRLKTVHETEKNAVYQLNSTLVFNDKQYNSEVEDRNVFFAIDELMRKVQSSLD